ncbi:MAG: type I-E CRISPR-associated protein Cas5/CasD [Proteobacteria bacterium]|nr:type I-E CRISPR-associated protein Cas5/CasD [Pseudomonadota bacterium]
MTDYLIFQLTAALGSMGELAGHERRGSLTWPGRSALVGLMAAAMGIRRDGDFSALDGLSVAVAIFSPGDALRDYHTVETVPSAAARRPQSRPAAMAEAGKLKTNTTITLRDYRTGPLYGVAVWGGALEPIRDALLRPVFTLYLGRKSCPLAAPLAPEIVGADSPEVALEALRLPGWRADTTAKVMISDGYPDAARQEIRHDIASDRRLWHFAPREFAVLPVTITAGGAA